MMNRQKYTPAREAGPEYAPISRPAGEYLRKSFETLKGKIEATGDEELKRMAQAFEGELARITI